jgi:hypothetical protein
VKPSIREPCFCPNVAYVTLVQQQEAGSSVSKPSPSASLRVSYLSTGSFKEKRKIREDGGAVKITE